MNEIIYVSDFRFVAATAAAADICNTVMLTLL